MVFCAGSVNNNTVALSNRPGDNKTSTIVREKIGTARNDRLRKEDVQK